MIFVDSNIPMYLVGRPHANKDRAVDVLAQLIQRQARLVSDVEVLQEILHRYVALDRREAIEPCSRALVRLVDGIFAVEVAHLDRARDLVLQSDRLSARDALHIAVMEAHGVTRILTFDRGFDDVPGLRVVR